MQMTHVATPWPLIGEHAELTRPDGHRLVLAAARLLTVAAEIEIIGPCADPYPAMSRWSIALSTAVSPALASFGIVEAMSLGLPVVATRTGNSAALVGGAGLVVEPDDPRQLALAIDRLLTDARLRRRCRAEARRVIGDGLIQAALVRTGVSHGRSGTPGDRSRAASPTPEVR